MIVYKCLKCLNHRLHINTSHHEGENTDGYNTLRVKQPGQEVIKLFSCSTQLSTKFILLINVKMPTIVGILTFISMINTTSDRLIARNFFICWCFSFNEQLKFHKIDSNTHSHTHAHARTHLKRLALFCAILVWQTFWSCDQNNI